MSVREAEGRAYEDWGALMEDLLHNEPERRELAFRKLNRLLSGFLGQLRAWDHGEEWQDLRQTVIMKLVKSFREGQLRESKAFVNYARTITRNGFYDLLRARRGEEVVEMPDVAADSRLDETVVLSVRTAFGNLPENHRKVVQAVYIEEMTYDEAAVATGIPLGSLKRYLRLGLAQLRAQLGGVARE